MNIILMGAYTVTRAGAPVDRGTFEFEVGTTLFILQGNSVAGGVFYAVMDTLDAGGTFSGLLMDDLQKPDNWYARFEVTARGPAPPLPPPATLPGGTFTCFAIEGASIVA